MSTGINSRFFLISNPYVFSTAITSSYLLFYTAYDKKTKQLTTSNLIDLFFLRRGLDWTLVEINKAISLSGLTILLTSFLPEFNNIHKELYDVSMYTLWIHSIYSYYKFYQLDFRKILNDKAMKQISILLGILGQFSISAGYFDQLSFFTLSLLTTTLGIYAIYIYIYTYVCIFIDIHILYVYYIYL